MANILTYISMILLGISGMCMVYFLFIKTYYPIKWRVQDWWWSKDR